MELLSQPQQHSFGSHVVVSVGDLVDGVRVAFVELARENKLNGLTLDMLQGLRDAARFLSRDRELRGVILTGRGTSFTAGLDFAAALKTPSSIAKAFVPGLHGTNLFQECCLAWRRVPVPVVAVIDGHCFGGGVQLALGADFRITTEQARWSVLEAKWGLIPDMSGVVTLVEQVGLDRAKWLAMSGAEFSGSEAVAYGLATEATETAEDAMARAIDMLLELATRSPDQAAAAKRLFSYQRRSARATLRAERWNQIWLFTKENTVRARKIAQKRAKAVADSGGGLGAGFARRGQRIGFGRSKRG